MKLFKKKAFYFAILLGEFIVIEFHLQRSESDESFIVVRVEFCEFLRIDFWNKKVETYKTMLSWSIKDW